MAVRTLHKLNNRDVPAISKPGRHADGGDLYLLVKPSGSKSWVFLFMFKGRQREAGLGSVLKVSLQQARKKAAEYRELLGQGLDPIEHKQAQIHRAKPRKTFDECARALIKSKKSQWRSDVHFKQWQQIIVQCGPMANLPVDQVDTPIILKIIEPLWQSTQTTAERLLQRIAAVLDYAKALGLRSGDNPARYKGHLEHHLPKKPRIDQKHHAALHYNQLPAFMMHLRDQLTIQSLALQFLILTAGRLGEVLNAPWTEIDFNEAVWSIPAQRMKSGHLHNVPLSQAALTVLEQAAQLQTTTLIFAGRNPKRPLSGHTLIYLTPEGTTIHGYRSSFRDWAGNETTHPREVAEQDRFGC